MSIGSTSGRRAAIVFVLVACLPFGNGCGTDGGKKFAGGPPTAEATFGECVFCHRDLSIRMTETGGHHDLGIKCEACHEQLAPGEFGPGHRTVPACRDCHEQQQTHEDPAAATVDECLTCHTPHGSTNLFLVRERIRTPAGDIRDVEFTQLRGVADGGLASASMPGSGLCEVCHRETEFFRSDGTGEEHFSFPCFTCHPHANGFRPD